MGGYNSTSSWKELAGREGGREGYQIGDLCRSLNGALRNREPEPCFEHFPDGLGPFSVRAAGFRTGDISVRGFDTSLNLNSKLQVARPFFDCSADLRALASAVSHAGGWKKSWNGSEDEALELCMSPVHAVNLPQTARAALGLPQEDMLFAWVYPITVDLAEEVVEALDVNNPDVSFLTIGGYIYFRPLAEKRDDPLQLEVLKALTIRFSTQGTLQFSAPRRMPSTVTARLAAQGRFQPVTARKWLTSDARHFCWIRPDEQLPDERGRDKPSAHHGGFLFLFQDFGTTNVTEAGSRFFEVVGSRAVPGSFSVATVVPALERTKSLPFRPNSSRLGNDANVLEKLFAMARESRWALFFHLLAEYPSLATAADKNGTTLLHACMDPLAGVEVLRKLKSHGACCDVQDAAGRSALDLGTPSARALVRSIFGLAPDAFTDPEAWFVFYAGEGSSRIGPEELSDALASSFLCNEIGRQWVKSYTHLHHPSGVSREELLDSNGLLSFLETSEDFMKLRQQEVSLPPLFRNWVAVLGDAERCKLVHVEDRLEQLRSKHGWTIGQPAPSTAELLQLPAPAAAGSTDATARMSSARLMLQFTFEQTRCFSGHEWRTGLQVNFAGQNGLDNGGLTKAWVNEIACALWGNSDLFDCNETGSFFKPDHVETLTLDGVPWPSAELYRWTGQFVAYALYQGCLMDCRLCPWTFRALLRTAGLHKNILPAWPDSPHGEDAMLADLASLDHVHASNLWRVRHEMSDDELRWLDFTCAGVELEHNGAHSEVTSDNKQDYVRLSCRALLWQRCKKGMEAFFAGFVEVVPQPVLADCPEDGLLQLLVGVVEVTEEEIDDFEASIVPNGLVPVKLREQHTVQQAASWIFRTVRESDSRFRTRLLEFWLGVGRVPLGGLASVQPRPKLQIMVQPQGAGVSRIASWPKERLPEGHTCTNELWIALPESYDDCAAKLKLAVGNFEAGFAMR